MNVLFLTLLSFDSLRERSIYTDLLREFVKNGHHVYAISPAERRQNVRTHLINEDNATILRLQIGNTQKTNVFEKGISTVMIEPMFRKAIDSFFSGVRFDLVLYSTPPITFVSAIEHVKKRDGARTYLLLKDIFPQNAVDMGMLSRTGLKGLIYRHFRNKEKKLYAVSDRIGCMSPANAGYLIAHNPQVDPSIVEVCPNSIEVVDKRVDGDTRRRIRQKYGIPEDRTVFVYGGNLGKPQGIPFMIECLRKCRGIEDAYFLIVGDGTEYGLLQSYTETEKPRNVRLMKRLDKADYDTLVGACDVGLIFLDHRFTIPNFPSRLLSYMGAGIPVLACTDRSTDVGKTIVAGGFGWWCESNDAEGFASLIKECVSGDTMAKGAAGYRYLQERYSVDDAYKTIMGEEGKSK